MAKENKLSNFLGIVFMVAIVLILFSPFYLFDLQIKNIDLKGWSEISNIGLCVLALFTLIAVWFTYRENRTQNKYLRTFNMISRFTGGSIIQRHTNELVNRYQTYVPILLSHGADSELANKADTVFSYFEELGMYADKELLDWDLIYGFFMGSVPNLYKLYSVYIKQTRVEESFPELYIYFERLSDKIEASKTTN